MHISLLQDSKFWGPKFLAFSEMSKFCVIITADLAFWSLRNAQLLVKLNHKRDIRRKVSASFHFKVC